MKYAVCAGLLACWLFAGPARAKDNRFDQPPEVSLIEARLVVNKDTYELDLAQRGEAFRKALREAPAPVVLQNGQGIQIIQGGGGGFQIQGRVQIQVMPAPANPQPPNKQPAPKKQDAEEGKTPAEKPDNDADQKDQPRPKDEPQPKDQPPPKKPQAKVQQQAQAVQIVQGAAQGIQIQAQVQGGQAAPQVKVVMFGQQHSLPPAVDLVLELRNASGQELTISLGGDDSEVALKLEGPGAVTLDAPKAAARAGARPGAPLRIPAGQTHRIPISRLQHGKRNAARSYWTEPGEYTLSATFATRLRTAADAEATPLEVTTPPVKIKVVEPK